MMAGAATVSLVASLLFFGLALVLLPDGTARLESQILTPLEAIEIVAGK